MSSSEDEDIYEQMKKALVQKVKRSGKYYYYFYSISFLNIKSHSSVINQTDKDNNSFN